MQNAENSFSSNTNNAKLIQYLKKRYCFKYKYYVNIVTVYLWYNHTRFKEFSVGLLYNIKEIFM